MCVFGWGGGQDGQVFHSDGSISLPVAHPHVIRIQTQDECFDEIAMADAARKARMLMKFKVIRTNASVLWEVICSVKNRTETCHH